MSIAEDTATGNPQLQVSSHVDGLSREIDFDHYSRLAGELTIPVFAADGKYTVGFRSLMKKNRDYLRPISYAFLTIAFELLFLLWLLYPTHYPPLAGGWSHVAEALFVISSIMIMELMRLTNVISLSIASVVARDPIPVFPEPGLRVAFVTTIVPTKEPIEMVRTTLTAARKIYYSSKIEVWLLDEGNSQEVKNMCVELGVKHFSRKAQERYNQACGPFKARSKHGNYNAWLDAEGHNYDVFLSVDPDHVPRPNYAERILGYFRDPNIAYVVGPQDYSNCSDGFVTMAAESQQFPFHSVIQRAANFYGSAMLVGTNNAFRVSALQAIGGLCDSVTEDMATGLALHASRNPETKARWRSVYTPDVLAVGEGPNSWGDYFNQQSRWSRGTFEVLIKDFWRLAPRLRPSQLFHYGLITTFYPSMAFGWLIGAVNAWLYAISGVSGIDVPVQVWFALYIDAMVFQVWLYVWNRRYNVSPFEAQGSYGSAGMLMSILSSPVYAAAAMRALLRLPVSFIVTPKGNSLSSDTLNVFRHNLWWTAFYCGAMILALANQYATPSALLWPGVAALVGIAPVVIWKYESRISRSPFSTHLSLFMHTPKPTITSSAPVSSEMESIS